MGDKRVYLILLMLPFSRVIFFRHDELIIIICLFKNHLIMDPGRGLEPGSSGFVAPHPLCYLSHCILGYIVLITSCQLNIKLAKFQP